MKLYCIALIVVFICLVSDSSADKPKKHKKYRKPHKKTSEAAAAKTQLDEINTSNTIEKNSGGKTYQEVPPQVDDLITIDPCYNVHCGAGRICQLDNLGDPKCVCIPTCAEETDFRRKVCSNHNETWPSDCSIYQQRCICETGTEGCKGPQYKHVHIDYYGECRNMPTCTEDEMIDFPRRMRDWLFNIMRDLADREELTPHYMEMEREAESNLTRRWTNAAIWKFCELDGNPPDRSVSIHELFPIRAPLMALEHCIAPFLKICDHDNNHLITLKEWSKCLELNEDEIEDRCEKIIDE